MHVVWMISIIVTMLVSIGLSCDHMPVWSTSNFLITCSMSYKRRWWLSKLPWGFGQPSSTILTFVNQLWKTKISLQKISNYTYFQTCFSKMQIHKKIGCVENKFTHDLQKNNSLSVFQSYIFTQLYKTDVILFILGSKL